jgi:hypothetical protein
MDRNFLFAIITLLALANATIYIQKNNSSFFSKFIPYNEKSDNWINQDFPKSENQKNVLPPKNDNISTETEKNSEKETEKNSEKETEKNSEKETEKNSEKETEKNSEKKPFRRSIDN